MQDEKKIRDIKKKIGKKLEKLKMKKYEIDDIISGIGEDLESLEGEEKAVKTGYGTSCVQLTAKNGKIITEY